MKKILVMVLCIFLAAMPALAEKDEEINIGDYSYMHAEPRDDIFAELGVEPATDADIITPAGKGWYVVSASGEKRLDVYVPNEGWKSVDFSELSEDAAESFSGRLGVVIKNNHYIYLSCSRSLYGYMIDLVEYKIRDAEMYGEYRVNVTTDGYLYSVINGDGQSRIEFVGFCEGWDISALGADAAVHYVEMTDNGMLVVVYANGSNELRAAWVSKEGIVQDNYLFPANSNRGILLYSDATDTLVYSRYGSYSTNDARMAISSINGNTKVVFCDYEEDLQGNIILGTTSEFVAADAASVVYDDAGMPETINGDGTAYEVYINIAPIALLDNDRFLLFESDNNYTAGIIDIATGEIIELKMDKDIREELFNTCSGGYNNTHWTTGEIIPCAHIDFKLVK